MRLTLILISLCTSALVNAASVATVSPIAHSMAAALVDGTGITVDYLPPKRLPINRIGSWINRNKTELFPAYDAFVSMSSLRPELDFYTTLRTANIRLVPVDFAVALLPDGERVSYQSAGEAFWLNPNNALMSLGIIKRDLSKIWPDKAETIEGNYTKISRALRAISLKIDDMLMRSGYDVVIVTNNRLLPFAASLSLPQLPKEEAVMFSSITLNTTDKAGQWQLDGFSRYSDLSFIQRWTSALQRLEKL